MIPPDTWGVYYSILGVTFAMISGLVLVQSLDRYVNLKMLFQEELNALQDIRDYLIFLDDVPKELITQIKVSLADYVHSLTERDWDEMKLKSVEFSDTTDEMRNIMKTVDRINIDNNNRGQSIALEGILNLIFTITTLRTKRFFAAKEGIHNTVFQLIVLMAGSILAGLMLMSVQHLGLHLFIVLTTHISLMVLLIILKDLSNPFSGMWKINLKGFELYLSTLHISKKKKS